MNVTVNIIICDDELNFLEYLYSRVEQIMLNHYKFQYKKCHILSNKYTQHLSVFMEDV